MRITDRPQTKRLATEAQIFYHVDLWNLLTTLFAFFTLSTRTSIVIFDENVKNLTLSLRSDHIITLPEHKTNFMSHNISVYTHSTVTSQRTNQTSKKVEEEEEIYLAQTQQIKCKYKSYTIQLSRVTGKPEGQLCRPP